MNPTCFQVERLLSVEECRGLIQWGEAGRYQATGQDYPDNYRNNDRVVADRPDLAKVLWERLSERLPERLERRGRVWLLDSLNPRFRGCRYRNGQCFQRHRDGAYSPDENRRSFLTVMLYLNGSDEFEGGATRFYADRYCESVDLKVPPRAGTAIVFDHDYWHDGQAVTTGSKYVLRTDVIYRTAEPLAGHRGYVWDIEALSCGRLVTGGRDKTVRVWSGSRIDEEQVLEGHRASVTCLAETPDGFASGSRDHTIAWWRRAADGKFELRRSVEAHQGTVLHLCLSDGGLVSSGADGAVKLWSSSDRPSGCLELGSWAWVTLPFKQGFLTATESGALLQLSSDLGEQRTVYKQASPLRSLCRLGDGDFLLGDCEGTLTLLSPTLRMRRRFQAHRGPVTCLLALPEGRFVSGGEDDGVKVWFQSRSEPLYRHDDFVRALCLVGDTQVASVSYDGSLQLSRPSAIRRTAPAAKPGGAMEGTVVAS